MAAASRVTNAFLTEFFNEVGNVAGIADATFNAQRDGLPPPDLSSFFSSGAQAIADFANAIASAAFQAGLDAWEGFDPRLTISGRIQPVLLGFPIGRPLVDGTIIVDKSGLTVELSARIAKILQLVLNQSFAGVGGSLVELLTLGFEDFTTIGYRYAFPEEELITIARGLLTGGQAILDPNDTELVPATDLVQAMLNLVNPFAGWEALISSEMSVAGFSIGEVSGVMFDRLDADQFDQTTGEPLPDPTSLAGSRIYNLDDDRDGEPDPDRVIIAENTPELIPVPTYAQYLDIYQKGGILLTGELKLPAVLRDPVGVISSIDWTPPVNAADGMPYELDDFTADPFLIPTAFGEYNAWIGQIIEALTRIENYGQLQMFIPSLSSLFDAGNYLQPYGTDETTDGADETILSAAEAAQLTIVAPG